MGSLELDADKTPTGRHRTKILTYRGRKVHIDRGIATLLSKMWKLGINTTNSCQAHCSFLCKHKYKISKTDGGDSYWDPIPTKLCYNNIWLCFESSADVEKLYNTVAEYTNDHGDEVMYHKMSCDRFVRTSGDLLRGSLDGWAFSFLMRNAGVRGHFGRPTQAGKRLPFEVWMEDSCTKNNFIIQPQLTIPHKHLEYVESRLDLALKQGKKRK